jgi:hypothetical protein
VEIPSLLVMEVWIAFALPAHAFAGSVTGTVTVTVPPAGSIAEVGAGPAGKNAPWLLGSGFVAPLVRTTVSEVPIWLRIWKPTEPLAPPDPDHVGETGQISGRPLVAAMIEALAVATRPPPSRMPRGR